MWTRRISPDGMRSVAQSPSFAISVTLVPAERPSCAPRPILSSTAWISVPIGMKRSGSELPGLMSAEFAAITVSPTRELAAARGCSAFSPSAYCRSARRAERFGSYSIAEHRRRDAGLVALEVDDAIALLVAAAAEPRRDAAVVVAAGARGLVREQALLRLALGDVAEVLASTSRAGPARSACTS